MAQSIALSTAVIAIGAGGDEAVVSTAFHITSASSLSCVPQIAVDSSNATLTNCQYVNLATGAVSAAGTALTANGVYAIYHPGCYCALNVTAGTATCFVQRVYGRAF